MTESFLLLFSFFYLFLLFPPSGCTEPNHTQLIETLNLQISTLEDNFQQRLSQIEDNFQQRLSQIEENSQQRLSQFEDNFEKRLSEIEEIVKNGKNEEDKTSFRHRNNTIEERLSYLEEVSKTKILRTCHELQHHGLQISGFYFIDPDGESLGHPPIEVYCDFESGVTEVLHDADNIVIFIPHCEEDHCFRQEYVYTSPIEQITSLIHLSSTCEQEIVYDCFLAPLIYNDVPIGTWFDRSGQEQVYFSGSNYGNHMCSCFSNNSCSGQDVFGNRCNCDSTGVPEWFEDAGIINNMTALPITAFSYGPLEYEMQQASVKVGRLRCKGEVDVQMPPSTCNDLKRMGETRTALYSLHDEDNQGYPKLSYCDMSKPGYEEDMETFMGWSKLSPSPVDVVFSVQHSGYKDLVDGEVITFDREITNKGTAMDLPTGVFTAPVTGLYEFKFSAVTGHNSEDTSVYIYVNEDIYTGTIDKATYSSSISRTWLLRLLEGDTVHLVMIKGNLYGGDLYRTEFIGMLL